MFTKLHCNNSIKNKEFVSICVTVFNKLCELYAMRMDDNSICELSSVVQKDLLLFNDVKAPISLDEFDILLQIVCDVLTKIPSTDQSYKQLEGKIEIYVGYITEKQHLIYFS